MSDYQFRPALSHASIPDYVELFQSSFADDKLNAGYLRWQYQDNPHGQVIGVDAYAGGKLAAHYAIIPRRYRLGAETFSAALSVNTATHPDHQGKGLFTRLATETYEIAKAQGVQFVVGAANANSVGGFLRKLEFISLGQIRLYAAFAAVRAQEAALDIDLDPAWLAWRFRNPSRTYGRAALPDGTVDLSTRLKGVSFHIARLSGPNASQLTDLPRGLPFMPGLTAYFGPTPPSLGRLPMRLQPSPWHVIWRVLDPDLSSNLVNRLRFDGLSMDTF